jgi:hypothetical protein
MYLNCEFTIYTYIHSSLNSEMPAAEYHGSFRWLYFSNVRYYKSSPNKTITILPSIEVLVENLFLDQYPFTIIMISNFTKSG